MRCLRQRKRRLWVVLGDLLLSLVAYLAANLIRFDGDIPARYWGFVEEKDLAVEASAVTAVRAPLVEAAVEAGEWAPGLGHEIDVTSSPGYAPGAERRHGVAP